MIQKIDATRVFKKAGYQIHYGRWKYEDDPSEPWVHMRWAVTLDGAHIGDPVFAYRLAKRGILPELADSEATVCTIGFSEKEQKWYGWSHRAIAGFGVGDKVDSEDHICHQSGWTDEYLKDHPEEDMRLPVGFEAKTLADAKRMALAFAEVVG